MRSVFEADAAAGLSCGAAPCWSPVSGGYRYRDPKRDHAAILSLQIAAAGEGRAKIKLKASGDALGPPPMPLAMDPAMRVQLLNLETDACWEATFSSASRNTSTQFKATSD